MTKRRTHPLASGLLALALAGTGCVNLDRPYAERRFHLIEVDPVAVAPMTEDALASDAVLLVRRLRISPGFEQPALVYRKPGGAFEADPYNAFFVPPAAMLTDEVIQGLAASGRFGPVLAEASMLASDAVLEGSVAALFGDFSEPESPRAVLAMQLLLLQPDREGARVLWRKDYELAVPAGDGTPRELVRAWSEGLAEILASAAAEMPPIPR